MKIERYGGFANGRWISDEKFEHADGRVTERLWCNPRTIYCGSDGTKRHGYYWKAGKVQPPLSKYLQNAYGTEADDRAAEWLGMDANTKRENPDEHEQRAI